MCKSINMQSSNHSEHRGAQRAGRRPLSGGRTAGEPLFFPQTKTRAPKGSCKKLSLGELGGAPSRLEAVLFALLHTRIAGEEACGRTEQISNSETLDITGFRVMADFFVSAINYFFFLVTAPSLPRILI